MTMYTIPEILAAPAAALDKMIEHRDADFRATLDAALPEAELAEAIRRNDLFLAEHREEARLALIVSMRRGGHDVGDDFGAAPDPKEN